MNGSVTFLMPPFAKLITPALLLDKEKLARNAARMPAGVPLRLHAKTSRSAEVIDYCFGGKKLPLAIANFSDAEYFHAKGFTDLIYAVGIAPNKFEPLLALAKKGIKLKIILDNMTLARALGEFAKANKFAFDVLLEIDCDGHRAGIRPNSPLLADIADDLNRNNQNVCGVLTHAGGAYETSNPGPEIFAQLSRQENAAANMAYEKLRARGCKLDIVSVGSTPTALCGHDFSGITEIRAGVFIFMDCVMASMGLCAPEEIAISVLASVIGTRNNDGGIIIDAGWSALSADRGNESGFAWHGYGLVADATGALLPGLRVCELNQEHGVILPLMGHAMPKLEPGDFLRILPVHACATASNFDDYNIIVQNRITAKWSRLRGW